ncbi:hypothetical protein FDUTEX481_03901 [Tolypothrix sp. PCC 7601]|nr:hypothetical protein FDUTEX481_03901 [Tolypothrix sp. PCC 7601]
MRYEVRHASYWANTCRLRAKGEGEKGQDKTFNPYPFTFSPNQISS